MTVKYSITIEDMTANDLAAVTAFLNGKAIPSQTLDELVAMSPSGGAAPSAPPTPGPYTMPPMPPAPAPAARAPVTTIGTSPPTIGALDSRGVRWHSDHHAASQRQNKDGTWSRRKGVDAVAADRYEAGEVSGNPVPMPPAPTPAPTPAETTAKFAPHLVETPSPAPPVAPAPPAVGPAAPPPLPSIEPVAYTAWHALYLQLMAEGKLTADKYVEIAGRYGAIEDKMKFYNDEDARALSYRDMQMLLAA